MFPQGVPLRIMIVISARMSPIPKNYVTTWGICSQSVFSWSDSDAACWRAEQASERADMWAAETETRAQGAILHWQTRAMRAETRMQQPTAPQRSYYTELAIRCRTEVNEADAARACAESAFVDMRLKCECADMRAEEIETRAQAAILQWQSRALQARFGDTVDIRDI